MQFTEIQLLPKVEQNEYILEWQVSPELIGSDFYVYKSETGDKPWILLNPDNPVKEHHYVDTIEVKNRTHFPFYRLLAVLGETKVGSEPISSFNLCSNKQEFGIVRKILKEEVRNMRARNGGVFQIFRKLKRQHEPVYEDEETRQSLARQFTTKEIVSNHDLGYSWGTNTYGQLSNATPRQTGYQAGMTEDAVLAQGRFLDIPPIYPGDVLRREVTGDLYIVNQVTPSFFKDVIPTVAVLQASLLTKSDIRHQLK